MILIVDQVFVVDYAKYRLMLFIVDKLVIQHMLYKRYHAHAQGPRNGFTLL